MGLKDFATGIVATAPSPATSGTTLVLGSGEGARMPATPFEATAHSPYDFPSLDTAEKIIVTDVTGDTLTFSRADGDTTAKSIDVGWRITAAVFKRNLQQTNAIPVTVSTAAATAAKTGTTADGDYSPKLGDLLAITFSSGCNVANPTVNIDGSGAVNLRLGNTNVTTALVGTTSALTLLVWFDGTYFQVMGSLKNDNTTYTEISTAEIDAGTASTTRSISGRRAQYIMDQAVSDVKAATNASEFGISIDEDDMSSDSATKLPTQQSVKAYVDDKTLGSNSFISDETPTGDVNGSNTSFTTSSAYISGTLEVFVNGVKQARTTHYTETTPGSGVFTMSDAPETGDVVRVNYQHTSGAAGNADTVDGFHASATPTPNTIPVLDANGDIAESAMPIQESWITPTLLNSWVNFGSPYAPARYMKDSLGFVHIEGLIKSGTNETIFNLPAGYRPATDEGLYFAVPISGGYGDLVIASGGNVKVYGSGRSSYSSISCTFKAGV